MPSRNGTSLLSPYLAAGVLSPRQCLHAAIDANGGTLTGGRPGVQTWISELIWREFFTHVLVGFPHVCRHLPFRRETDRVAWRRDKQLFERWKTGTTGYPIVDAAQRQLLRTGWMHNRLRMVSAMFLSKDLLLDWRLGERHFMRHLIDGDLAANNGGWQWSASTGTDAAPYFRIFNPAAQSKKFDPDGTFIKRFCPELKSVAANAIHDPSRWPEDLRASLDYPALIVDHAAARCEAIKAFEDARQPPRTP